MELVILLALAIYAISYRLNPDADVEGTFKFIKHGIGNIYEKYAPYSYKQIREKTKELGEEYTIKQYVAQVILFAGVAGGIAFDLVATSPRCAPG